MLPWREHADARREAYDAAGWYADRDLALAERFARELQQSVRFIQEWPSSSAADPDFERIPPIRSKGVNGFPYRIVYIVHDDEIVVLAYAHQRRRPGYWSQRLDD